MHAALLLATLTIGTGPSIPPGDIAEPGLELSGCWEGSWSREGETVFGAVFQDGRLTLPMTLPWTVRFTLNDEGRGRCRGRFGDTDFLGIYQRQDERIVLCLRGVDRSCPTRFVAEDWADVVILRRVRARR
jgi:hypothetical protein